MVAHCRLRESNTLIKAIQSLSNQHPIRRLLTPFIYGSAYSNRVYNEYLRKNGLFDRCFGFTYNGLTKLMFDAMANAPATDRTAKDDIKYRWRLITVRCIVLCFIWSKHKEYIIIITKKKKSKYVMVCKQINRKR